MKLFVLVVISCVSIYVGYLCSKKYKVRANFFQAMVYLCQKFDVEINYSRERVKNIFLGLDEKQKNKLKGIDINYLSFIDKEAPLEKAMLFKDINFLKEEEKDLIFMFFKGLGRSDVDSQSKEIKNFQNRFETLSANANNENKKYGSLSIKLGFIAGLFILVVFI